MLPTPSRHTTTPFTPHTPSHCMPQPIQHPTAAAGLSRWVVVDCGWSPGVCSAIANEVLLPAWHAACQALHMMVCCARPARSGQGVQTCVTQTAVQATPEAEGGQQAAKQTAGAEATHGWDPMKAQQQSGRQVAARAADGAAQADTAGAGGRRETIIQSNSSSW